MAAKTRDLAPGATKKLVALLDRLEKRFGPVRFLPGGTALDQVLFLILREGNDYRRAQKAIHALKEEYVEWNELRVATPKELVAVLEPLRLKNLDDKISKMLAFLSRLFYGFHKKDLEFVRIFEAPQREKIMLTLDAPVGHHITYVILQRFEDESPEPDGLVFSRDAYERVQRMGLVRRTTSPNVAHKLLKQLVPYEDRYRFHSYIHRYEP